MRAVIGMSVPYDDPRLHGAPSGADARNSPFVLAIESVGTTILHSLMNAVIVLPSLVALATLLLRINSNACVPGREAIDAEGFCEVDRCESPIVAIMVALSNGLLAHPCPLMISILIYSTGPWLTPDRDVCVHASHLPIPGDVGLSTSDFWRPWLKRFTRR